MKGSSPTLRLFRNELLIAFRNRGELVNPLLFFVMVTTLVPLGVGADSEQLAGLAAGVIWVFALLANLLSLDSLFRSDYEDGSLEQLLLLPGVLVGPILAKVTIHWLTTGLPLTLIAPLLALMLSLPPAGVMALLISLCLGSAFFSLVGAIGAALTVSLRRGGLLLSLIIMPLYIPVLIFGVAVVHNALVGQPYTGPLAVLASLLALAIALAPLAIIAGLRIAVDE